MTGKVLAETIARLGLEKKGDQIAILDIRGLSSATDFFVIISVDSDIQMRALAVHIAKQMQEQHQVKFYHKEGEDSAVWVLLDYIDVVVHLFRRETRAYYGLERLWSDAKITWITEETENA